MAKAKPKWQENQCVRWAIFSGIAVFITGFGVIISFWYLGTWPHNVPGFWTYRTPNFGDGLLLPVTAGLLVAGACKLPRAYHEMLAIVVSGLLGLLGGGVLQFIWLADPNPLLNWTVPAPHTFNAPGIYHAVFLSITCAFFAGAVIRLLWRIHDARLRDPSQALQLMRSPFAALLIAYTVGFGGLVALDGHHVRGFAIKNTPTSVSATLTMVVAVVCATLVVVWGLGRIVLSGWRSLVFGLVLAFCICLVTWNTFDGAFLPTLAQVLIIDLIGSATLFLMERLQRHAPTARLDD